jgi:hypothetical protein
MWLPSISSIPLYDRLRRGNLGRALERFFPGPTALFTPSTFVS